MAAIAIVKQYPLQFPEEIVTLRRAQPESSRHFFRDRMFSSSSSASDGVLHLSVNAAADQREGGKLGRGGAAVYRLSAAAADPR